MSRRFLAILAVLLAVVPAASAHEGQGALAVVAADPAGPLAVSYRVRLTFLRDGHPVDDATVTAVAEAAGQPPQAPHLMAPAGGDGVYSATVQFPSPGEWRVRFTAVTPPATAERAEAVAPPPTTTTTTAPVRVTTPDGRPDGLEGFDWGQAALFIVVTAAVAGLASSVPLRRRRRGPKE